MGDDGNKPENEVDKKVVHVYPLIKVCPLKHPLIDIILSHEFEWLWIWSVLWDEEYAVSVLRRQSSHRSMEVLLISNEIANTSTTDYYPNKDVVTIHDCGFYYIVLSFLHNQYIEVENIITTYYQIE